MTILSFLQNVSADAGEQGSSISLGAEGFESPQTRYFIKSFKFICPLQLPPMMEGSQPTPI